MSFRVYLIYFGTSRYTEFDLTSIVIPSNYRRKEREQKKSVGAKNKKRTRSSSTRSSAKKAMPAKKRGAVKKKAESDSENDEAPDTSGDVALAQSLAGKRVSARNLDKKGKQFKKQAALAKIREVSYMLSILHFASG